LLIIRLQLVLVIQNFLHKMRLLQRSWLTMTPTAQP